MTRADVIVAGLGAMGSAVAYQLALRGVKVQGFDRHHPPHPYGSSHGETRITRTAIGEGPEYVPLVRRSEELWRAIEAQTGSVLHRRTGGLVVGPPDGPFLARTRESARRYDVAHEDLSHAELARRFPMFAVDPGVEAYFEPGAGVLRPEAAIRAELGLAARHGAELRFGEPVRAWTADGGGVTVTTDAGRHQASQLVLCAGPWITDLFPGGAGLFRVYRQLLYWFPVRTGYEQLARMPIFIWELGEAPGDFVHLHCFYGFPALDGPDGGVKVATEIFERPTVPDDRIHPSAPAETAAFVRRFVAPRLPWLGHEPVRTTSCLYTSTRASRFVIDRHPEHEAVTIVSACSGHGFKHSAAIGEAVAERITGTGARADLSPFTLSAA